VVTREKGAKGQIVAERQKGQQRVGEEPAEAKEEQPGEGARRWGSAIQEEGQRADRECGSQGNDVREKWQSGWCKCGWSPGKGKGRREREGRSRGKCQGEKYTAEKCDRRDQHGQRLRSRKHAVGRGEAGHRMPSQSENGGASPSEHGRG